MFPVRYGLNFYILFRESSVFKGLTFSSCNKFPKIKFRPTRNLIDPVVLITWSALIKH